jgi:hypothetical protein
MGREIRKETAALTNFFALLKFRYFISLRAKTSQFIFLPNLSHLKEAIGMSFRKAPRGWPGEAFLNSSVLLPFHIPFRE